MEQRLSLVTLGVTDLPRARAFYEGGLEWSGESPDNEVVFYQLPGLVFAIWGRAELAHDANVTDTGATFSGMALAYNTRLKEEVDEVLVQAVDAGGTLLKAAYETSWGGYSGYFADPDGHTWEIAFNPFWDVSAEGYTTLGSP
ncbi:VOC family protein [Aeromicrobium panaciterrae]|uniref:VOC family protein n=1 Tax=Aeromicrobium panaciterrae TaxID=363861 RepID=UPI0031CFE732